jgi:hypothetical protein
MYANRATSSWRPGGRNTSRNPERPELAGELKLAVSDEALCIWLGGVDDGEFAAGSGERGDAGSDCCGSIVWRGERWRLDGKEAQRRIGGVRAGVAEGLVITGSLDSVGKVAGSGNERAAWRVGVVGAGRG